MAASGTRFRSDRNHPTPATVQMTVNRMTDTDTTPEQEATLEDLMTEVERRLGIDRNDMAADDARWVQ